MSHTDESEPDDLGRPSLPNLKLVKKFMVESKAFTKLRNNFRHFVSPAVENKPMQASKEETTDAEENTLEKSESSSGLRMFLLPALPVPPWRIPLPSFLLVLTFQNLFRNCVPEGYQRIT
jgi:hypothetical protein